MSHRKAVMLLMLSALLWSTGGIIIKLVQWHPIAIAGWRSAIGLVVIGLWAKRLELRPSLVTLLGGLFYAGTVVLFVLATKMTTAANAILLQYTAPIYVALFSRYVLKESTSKLDWATIALTLFGMVLFFGDEMSATNLKGNIFGVVSGICFGGFVLTTRKQAGNSPIQSVLYGNIIAALAIFPYLTMPPGGKTALLGLILLGVIQLALPYILYSVAINHVQAVEASLILVLEPILNPIWVFIIVSELPGKSSMVGGLVVIVALVGRSILTNRKIS